MSAYPLETSCSEPLTKCVLFIALTGWMLSVVLIILMHMDPYSTSVSYSLNVKFSPISRCLVKKRKENCLTSPSAQTGIRDFIACKCHDNCMLTCPLMKEAISLINYIIFIDSKTSCAGEVEMFSV